MGPAVSGLDRPVGRPGAFHRRPWSIVLPIVVVIGCWPYSFLVFVDQRIFGAHAAIYTDAARTMAAGGNPWLVGPDAAVFAGPPTMLIPYLPFIALPLDLTRLIWVVVGLLLAAWTLRRLGLPAYFLVFPPIFTVIVVGHLELIVLWLLVAGGHLGGLGALLKPYACAALVAERRWRAIALAGVVLLATAFVLPWQLFFEELPRISANLARQTTGDSIFGQPILMVAGAVALASLGLRRALWLAVPVLWPYAQPTYKTMTVPALSPVLALFWASPIPGSTFVGIVVEAALIWIAGRRALPRWLGSGVGEAKPWEIPWRRRPESVPA